MLAECNPAGRAETHFHQMELGQAIATPNRISLSHLH